MQNENVNFEFLVDQLREITAERNNLRGLVEDVRTLQLRIDVLTCFKTKAFEILKKRADIIESLKRDLEIQAENYRRDTEALRQQIPNPDYVSMDSVAKKCQDIHATLELDRLQSKNSFLRRSLERSREIGTTWRRRCQDLMSRCESNRMEIERLKLQVERAEYKANFLTSMKEK